MAIPMHYETGHELRSVSKACRISGGAGDEGLLDPEHMLLGATEAYHFNTFMAIVKNLKVTILKYSSKSTDDLSFTKGQGDQFERIVVKPNTIVPEADLE